MEGGNTTTLVRSWSGPLILELRLIERKGVRCSSILWYVVKRDDEARLK